jgi:hypothetical protein
MNINQNQQSELYDYEEALERGMGLVASGKNHVKLIFLNDRYFLTWSDSYQTQESL